MKVKKSALLLLLLTMMVFPMMSWAENKPKEVEITGIVHYMPFPPIGMWRIGDYDVLVTPQTEFDAEECILQPGALAEAEGFFHGAVFIAREVDCEDPDEKDD